MNYKATYTMNFEGKDLKKGEIIFIENPYKYRRLIADGALLVTDEEPKKEKEKEKKNVKW